MAQIPYKQRQTSGWALQSNAEPQFISETLKQDLHKPTTEQLNMRDALPQHASRVKIIFGCSPSLFKKLPT